MNLVQINERLKDLPMQVIQQYANGMNPEVPPYLALGELQRRELSQKQAATAQGGAQGPQPSVKEQMEQKAGLMQAQQLQQQQMAQQMQQPRGPMPAPAGIPQPEAQPEMAMARGGLTSIPVRPGMFEYADGGIIAFQVGGKAPRVQDEVPITEEEREKLQRELLMRLVGEEARNPPSRKPPMEMTESDMTSIPGMEQSDLMARAMQKAAGPQPDNRAMLNAIDTRDARRTAMLEREQEKSAARPKYETPYDRLNRENRENAAKPPQSELESLIAARERYVKSGSDTSGIDQAIAALQEKNRAPASRPTEQMTPQQMEGPPSLQRNMPITRQATQMTPQQMEAQMSSGLPDVLKKVAPSNVRPAPELGQLPPPPGTLSPVKTIPGAPGVQTEKSGLPAAAAGSPFMAEAAALARQKPTAPTAAGIISEQAALAPASMQEAAMQKRMEDQRARAAQERTAYEKSRPSGLDELIRVFGQAGQYKGLSGTGPAYTAMQQQKRAEDLGMERRQNELLTATEGREYEGGKELFGARTKAMDVANKSYQDRLTSNAKVLADLAGVDERRMTATADRLSNMEIAKLREATANRSASEKKQFEASYLAKKSQARDLASKGDPASTAAAARLEAEASDMLMIRTGAAAGERNDITAEKSVQSSLLKELSENLRMDPATRARKQTELDESTERLRQLGGGTAAAKPSPAQAGKVPPPPPGFKVN